MKKTLIILFISIQGFVNAQNYGTLVDQRDGKTYKTVKIGAVEIMAENLNYDKHGRCYKDEELFCLDYGRLYSYDEITQGDKVEKTRGICPEGWHVPSHSEWLYVMSKMDGIMERKSSKWKLLSHNILDLKLTGNFLKARTMDNFLVFWPAEYTNLSEMGFYATSSTFVHSDMGTKLWWGLVRFVNNGSETKKEYPYALSVGNGDKFHISVSCRCIKD